mgnify:FL=1
MKAHLRKIVLELSDAFWTLPAVIVLFLCGLAVLAVDIQAADALPSWIPDEWIYGGGDTGARTLLGAIASSTISVAGTLFSITIAALTLASSQMGPRLLRNFMRDRGNQVTLGVFLGTFGYALIALRSVRGGEDSAFVPSLGVTIGLVLAGACVALLIYFIHHVASRINVHTVIDLVHDDVLKGMERLTLDQDPPARPDAVDWGQGQEVSMPNDGHLQQIETDALVDWAEENDCVIRFLKRPGEFVFPHVPIARVSRPVEGAGDAIRNCIALSRQGGSPTDLTFPVGQLVEVAVRALSPGVNDPRTAISVLNRLGATLASLSRRSLDDGARDRNGVVRVRFPPLDYSDLTDVMFEMIRESAGGSPSVLIHMVTVLTEVAGVETVPERLDALRRHARIADAEGQARFINEVDRQRLSTACSACLSIAALSSGKAKARPLQPV